MLAIKIISKDCATHAQIGIDLLEAVIGMTDLPQPERHYLHQTLSAGRGYRPAIEAALDVDHGQHEFRGRDRRGGPSR